MGKSGWACATGCAGRRGELAGADYVHGNPLPCRYRMALDDSLPLPARRAAGNRSPTRKSGAAAEPDSESRATAPPGYSFSCRSPKCEDAHGFLFRPRHLCSLSRQRSRSRSVRARNISNGCAATPSASSASPRPTASRSAGCGGEHILDTSFDLAKNIVNDTLHFSLRIDAVKLPADLLRAYTAIELKALASKQPQRPAQQSPEPRGEAKSPGSASRKRRRTAGILKRKSYPLLWDARRTNCSSGPLR